MIQIDNQIISSDVVTRKFACNLSACNGMCCIEGDSGAPLSESETHTLEKIYSKVRPYMTPQGLQAIEKQGVWVFDFEGDRVTPLIDNQACAYTYYENGIALCAIEKAFFKKKISFRKPISCHLYPIRISEYENFDAVNYDVQKICAPARRKGQKENIPVYVFLKQALVRRYGKNWYKQLEAAAKEILK